MTSPTNVVLALYRAIENGDHGTALGRHFTDDATTLEHPNLVSPSGGEYDLAAILQGSERGAALLTSQRYDVQSIQEVGDLAISRLTWTGTAASSNASLAERRLVAHIAQFVTVRDDRIARIETYDCYEPLTP